jgi:uncharacterized BrkB/YihY/UPF0761 family membrane protein
MFNAFYGPLDKQFCSIYIFFATLFLFAIGAVLVVPMAIFSKNERLRSRGSLFGMISIAVIYFLSYINARIMYNVCQKTL